MSADSTAFFVFEPFQRFVTKYGIEMDEHNVTHEPSNIKFVQQYMRKIFDCRLPEGLLKLKRLMKNLNQCSISKPKVVKTIRLRREHIEAWIKTSNVKVNLYSKYMLANFVLIYIGFTFPPNSEKREINEKNI